MHKTAGQSFVANLRAAGAAPAPAIRAATNRAIAAYGSSNCVKAYKMNEIDGHGASTIGFTLGLTTRQADAAINAGRQIALLAWEAGLTPIGLRSHLQDLDL